MPLNPPSKVSKQPALQRPCGLLRRILIMAYDTIVVLTLMMFATGALMVLQFGNFTAGKDPWYTLYLLLVWFLYLGWCWQHGGMTLGMRAWQVKLIPDDGVAFGWAQSASRFGISLMSAVLLGAGFAWSLLDLDRRTWHDRASRSRLVRLQRGDM